MVYRPAGFFQIGRNRRGDLGTAIPVELNINL